MAKSIMYHGSSVEVKGPKILTGLYTKDFGYGFYCTVIREQAERWAKRFETPTLNSYNFLINQSLKILEFKEMSEDWLDFIIDCRKGKSHNYDIVIGSVANDQVYNYIGDYIDGVITREQFWVLAQFKYPTQQIAFCSDESLKCIQFLSAEEVSK